MMKYVVYCQYEHWTKNGKEVCNWFRISNFFDTEKEAIDSMTNYKNTVKDIDKKTKLKHFYDVRYVDETLYCQSNMKIGKGRYKKIIDTSINNIIEDLTVKRQNETLIDPSICRYIFNKEDYRNYINTQIKDYYKNKKWCHFWYDDDENCYAILKNIDQIVYKY